MSEKRLCHPCLHSSALDVYLHEPFPLPAGSIFVRLLIRVTINFSAVSKHELPVDRHNCPWAHPGGTVDPGTAVCVPAHGASIPENWESLGECVITSRCPIVDDSLQMATLRDPREVTVSLFYFWVRHSPMRLERFRSMDHFFLETLPTLSKWLGVRFLLFVELIGDQSSVFWYDDATSNPAGWFSQFFSFAGLNTPPAVLDETIHAHDEGGFDLGFRVQRLDDHPNGTVSRSYKDEVSADIIEEIDDILRQWLPPAFLIRIGVSNDGLTMTEKG